MNELRANDTGLRLRSHCVHMDNRELMSVTGVTDVGCFNEHEVVLNTDAGEITISGGSLHITKLDLDDGQVMLEGEIDAVEYADAPPARRTSLLSRIFH